MFGRAVSQDSSVRSVVAAVVVVVMVVVLGVPRGLLTKHQVGQTFLSAISAFS